MKKIFYSALLMLAALGASSCEDNINLQPVDKVDISQYFNTATDLELFSNTFYNDLLDSKPYSYQDDHIVKQTLSAELLCGNARTVPATGGGWSWSVLRKINTLLAYAPEKCSDKAAVAKYTGVARFFRAYFYFDMVKRFGDVPWIDRELGSADDELYNPRDSRELVMTKMLEDLDYAIANLPDNAAEKNVARVTRGAALALKSQVCLFEGTFRKYHNLQLPGHDYKYYLEQCVQASDQLMSGAAGKYSLYSTGKPDQDYRDLFASSQARAEEYILAVIYDINLSIFHNANAYTLIDTQGCPSVTRKFVASYLMKDGSRFTDRPGWQTMVFADEMKDRDPRLSQTIRTLGYKRIGGTDVLALDLGLSSTGYQPVKYVSAGWEGSHEADRTSRSFVDMPVLRYAEVLLNYAEAKAELGQLSQADLDRSVNLLRKRVGMPAMKVGNQPDPYLLSEETGYFNLTGANIGDILEIRRERAIELFQEHRRYYDLMRWRCGRCINQPLTGMYIPGPGQYDMTGDGKPNVQFYANGTPKPAAQAGVIAYELGKNVLLTDGNKGYTNAHSLQNRKPFDEQRDYLFPIPRSERELNPNLTQNPGWDDGL